MKWSFVIQQKLRAALLLSAVMLMIILGTLISSSNMRGVDKSFASIYKDRLVPATTITYLTENLYGKRLSLEKYLLSDELKTFDQLSAQLLDYDNNIDSLIYAFEKTYLVDEEAKSLATFRIRVAEYVSLEKRILSFYESGATKTGRKLFEGEAADTFQNTINNLNELTSIQSRIGKELMRESQSEMASVGMISFLQIALAIVVGLIILIFIQNSKIISQPGIHSERGSYFNPN